MKYSIIIPTINQVTLVDQCISTFKKYHNKREYEIIVVDDGSTKAVKEKLKKLESIDRLILNNENLGFSKSINKGISNARGDIVILCNNDIIFTKEILSLFSKAFESNDNIGIVGGKLLYPDNTIQHAGIVRISDTRFGHIHGKRDSNTSHVNNSKYYLAVTGALFGITRETINKIGKLNENFFLACEDVEYCLRAWNKNIYTFYSCEIEAIHLEGFTRGNNHQSKLDKGKLWYLKEQQGIIKFEKSLDKFNIPVIETIINNLNNKINIPKQLKKIEIGCGYNPQLGYIHIDIRKLPGVDIICDFEKEKLPFNDNDLDEIISNHVIEHVSWRSLPFILEEWYRVLRKGGRVFLRTPDLEFICKTYLEGKTTPEWPGDEFYIQNNLSEVITPAWWANIKLFAGQDYEANFHKLCFDYTMLENLFKKFGFNKCSRLNIQPVYSPGEIQFECYKK